ncbi:MAG: M43 family zinc metalloprotease [Niastella sp.]|uniref:M43 family zinc metalloprotease n=1 Tax=Niastella sp. TaxID=1869183 RepID=UPI00389A8FC1
MFLKKYGCVAVLVLLQGFFIRAIGQQMPVKRCATMEVLQRSLEKDETLRARYENDKLFIQQLAAERASDPGARVEATPVYIPVVFHIVLSDPNEVTDKMIEDQMKVLNRDFAGLNADSVNILPAFKPLFGKSKIQFVLAKRTPANQPTNGIERVVTTQQSFTQANNYVKHASTGGANAWNSSKYMNVWVCTLGGGLLGYSTFPGTSSADEQGVVMYSATLPGGLLAGYNDGRTLTHESGHYFFLFHIWGDDDGACTGSDNVNDTPNQSDASSGCHSGVVTDACSPAAPGIMYQNYMDYSSDGCMALFTLQQVTRMEAALNGYRLSLTTSNGAVSPLKDNDAQMVSIDNPVNRVCDTKFQPSITIRNYGALPLTSLVINASVDNGPAVQTQWTGSLASLSTAAVTLNPITTGSNGSHTLKIQLTLPNGTADLGPANDTLSKSFVFPTALAPPLTEGFESETFPAAGWEIINADGSYTWERVTGIAKTGHGAIVVRNNDYTQNGQIDYLRMPQITLANSDSAFLTFQVAAAIKTATGTLFNYWDTLQVLVSTDCGNSFTNLYKKWGGALATRSALTTSEFIPTASEWRKDSVNLTPWINKGPVMIAFANSTGNENNIYLDDINLYTKGSNANLEKQGWQITPNPTGGPLAVQFINTPVNLKAIIVLNSTGQKVAEKVINNNTPATLYQFNLNGYASGVYVVRLVYSDHTVSRKIIRK